MPEIIILIISVVIVSLAFIAKHPKRWLQAQPLILNDDGIVVCIKNRSKKTISLENLGVAWETGKNHFHCIQFEEKFREILPDDSFTEILPFGLPLYESENGDPVPDIRKSKIHKIAFSIIIDGKLKLNRFENISTIKVELINKMTQPVN